MKVTIPHMGNVYIGAKALFDGLDIEYVIPPESNKRALETGSLYSPEEICLPFKISLGNYIQSIEQGADTVIITGSCGPCRFGEYCEMQMKLLRRLGYDVDFIVLDVPRDIGVNEFLKRIGKIAEKSSRSGIDKLMALKNAVRVTNLIDEIEAKAHEASGYEKNKGECSRILKKCKKEMMECKSPKEMIDKLIYYRERLKNIERDGFDGAIQIFPMGCMPEIVAKSILPSISRDLNFPIMTLVVDEMTGEAGYLTRIEAFIDLLERRRANVLFRS